MFYDNQLNSHDIGSMEQNAWDEGFEDGMEEIIQMIGIFKESNNQNMGYRALINALEKYIDENKPRRNRQ